MKISIIKNISVLRFYKYIVNIEDISMDFFIQNIGDVIINENYEKNKKKTLKNYIKS